MEELSTVDEAKDPYFENFCLDYPWVPDELGPSRRRNVRIECSVWWSRRR